MGYAPTLIMFTANRTNPRAFPLAPVIPFISPAPTGSLIMRRNGDLCLGMPYGLKLVIGSFLTIWSSGGAYRYNPMNPGTDYLHHQIPSIESTGMNQKSVTNFDASRYSTGGNYSSPFLIRPNANERYGDETWWIDFEAFYYKANATGSAGESPLGTYDWHSNYAPAAGPTGYDDSFASPSWNGGINPASNDWHSTTPFPTLTITAWYSISYSGNGQTSGGAPATQVKDAGVTLVLQTNSGSLAKTGKTFSGWNTAADGSGTDYAAGGNYTTDVADVVLYAKWT